jgi:hypothetical protein
MANIQDPEFNKNVSMVYTEEPGFTGYKGLDFTKIDDVEQILRVSLATGENSTNSLLSGIYNNKLFITGDSWPLGVKGNIVYQADLNPQFDGVQTYQEQSSNISNYGPSGITGTIMGANAYRRELYIQNLATGTLYVKYGSNISPSSFNFILARNTAINEGNGGELNDKGYNGEVSVSGINVRYIGWERY